MLDPNMLRNELEFVANKLSDRGFQLDVEVLRSLEMRRKLLQLKCEKLQAEHNVRSKSIGYIKSLGESIQLPCEQINTLVKNIQSTKIELQVVRKEIHDFCLELPNLAANEVPIGQNSTENHEVSYWGNPRKFDFSIKDHVHLGKLVNGLDFNTAVKLSGTRFIIMQGEIAHLYRALSHFMMDLHIQHHGYLETYVPYLVNQESLYGTGQLPKFSEDLFHTKPIKKEDNNDESSYTLIPTAEVPLTNLVRDKILEEDKLPIKLIACTPCFRSEAGSYGRYNRGLIRMHQFDKVELVHIVTPERSMLALEELVSHAEKVLQLLDLPYRKVLLCTGDLGFSATKTYDLEVWLPSQSIYCEISSCSNMSDFQSRRMQARFREKTHKKIRLLHTLNGSGLAVGRTLVAVLENYQQKDGSIAVPEVLRPYMYGLEVIR